MRITGAGNVGIGTTGPLHKLDVVDSVGTDVHTMLLSSSNTQGTILQLANTNSATKWNVSMGGNSGWANNSFLIDEEGVAPRFVINPGGNVGIGTTTPSASGKLTISGGDNSFALFGPNTTWASYLWVGSGYGRPAASTASIASTNGNLHLDSGTANDMYLNYYVPGRPIHMYGSLDTAYNLTATEIYSNSWFRNNASGVGLYNTTTGYHWYSDSTYWNTSGNGIRMRAGYGGAIKGYLYYDGGGIGLLNDSGNWAVRSNFGGANVGGTLYGPWTVTNIIYTSDRRLKTDIKPIEVASTKIGSLNPVSYRWNAEAAKRGMTVDHKRHIGLIAQDVEAVFPEAVHTDKDGYKAVDYPSLVAPLVAAVKEQMARIADLVTKVAGLIAEQVKIIARLDAHDDKLAALEKENAALIKENAILKEVLIEKTKIIETRLKVLEQRTGHIPQPIGLQH